MGFMYILICADKTFYVGGTRDLLYRLRQHKRGEGAEYTKRRRPVRLVYYEEYPTVAEAFWREHRVQGLTRSKKKRLISNGPGVGVDDDTTLFGAVV
ncbi:GIY-YIG nuclease family protein [Aeromicrobium terrae]|uniref:GIY-YIG nuclease family protein n=1 Tax=Aeromicrobium terrae TaxID=2498846 RepID=A0A5C8NHM1_9ACTN|nr:GIY-YIG nuclease family protein [Aeromicrobium terrae]TXL57646.1 GIY-YIG nuclease family protein [Aeromicrobium terrae]